MTAAAPRLEPRVSALEEALLQLAHAQAQTQRNLDAMAADTRAFKEDMRQRHERAEHDTASFKQEMLAFKEQLRLSSERAERDTAEYLRRMDQRTERAEQDTASFKQEMLAFKEQLRLSSERAERDTASFKQEMRQSRIDLNRQLGGIANKQGRMVEDIVFPGARSALHKLFGHTEAALQVYTVRYLRRHPHTAQQREFDLVAVWADSWLIGEAKSTPSPESIARLVESAPALREFFPEYRDRKLHLALASLHADPSLVRAASRAGVIVLGVGEELMEVLNDREFLPGTF